MTISSFPFEDTPTDLSQYRTIMGDLQDAGVIGGTDSLDLSVAPTPATTLSTTVSPGIAFLQGCVMVSTENVVLSHSPVAANTGGQRLDRIVVRLDPVANTVTIAIKEGTATVAPNADRFDGGVWEEPLARVTVALDGSVTVLDGRRFTGMRVGAWFNANTRPIDPRPYQLGFNIQLQRWEYYDGSSWVSLLGTDTGWTATPAGAITASAGFTISLAEYRVKNGDVWLNVTATRKPGSSDITAGSTGNLADTQVFTASSSFYRPSRTLYDTFSATTTGGGARLGTDGACYVTDAHPGSSISAGQEIRFCLHWPI